MCFLKNGWNITDLFSDLRDGTKLIKLLEILTNKKLVSFGQINEKKESFMN